jgi:hypothetical protein
MIYQIPQHACQFHAPRNPAPEALHCTQRDNDPDRSRT